MHGGVGGRGCKVPSYPDQAADFSDTLLNFRIFAAQISVRQTCHCRN
jgi:hypothetical protein